MMMPIHIRCARAPLILKAPESARLDFQTRSRLACVAAAANAWWNKGDRYQELRTAKWERWQFARELKRPAAAARPRAGIGRRRESRLPGKAQQRLPLSSARLRCG